jgi:glycine cleavage system H protein
MTMERVVKVSEEHLWIGVDDQHVHLGLTNFIQSELGKIISVELPEVGDKIEKGEAFAEVESVSTVHELISPVSGTVLASIRIWKSVRRLSTKTLTTKVGSSKFD